MNGLSCIEKLNRKLRKRKKPKIDQWIVLEGKPVFTCRTRRQARKYRKTHKVERSKGWSYVGKCVDNYSRIILDV